ncbi:hypothetical protein [uncultured Hoeflea sp.]|uniref:hypothetical protein n=1 Tax=uncultured Hoeflea sp. TaxID=538666 RepID=UPI0030DCAE8C|tara:strand:+ start:1998 stop:2789 length:792 start_codon:yes stop_codon:yes gene_type:complete
MGIAKPFHRNFRAIKQGPNSGFSGTAYITDSEYAENAEHYVRAFTLIQNDLGSIFEYVEPSDECRKAYSYRIHALLMRTCIEIEANFKAIFAENIFTPPIKRMVNINDYRKVDVTHHLSSYEVMLPIWGGSQKVFRPFNPWRVARGQPNTSGTSLSWYQAYNQSKHDRFAKFKEANLENLVTAVAGLLVLISSQFRDQEFSAGSVGLALSGYDIHPMEAATGSLFRIKYPEDWSDAEQYDFDWSILRGSTDRFAKIDFDVIPS